MGRNVPSAVALMSVGFLVLVCAVASGEEMDRGERPLTEKSVDSVKVIFELDKAVYQLGEPVVMSLMITNENPHAPVELTFASAQRYDFTVTEEEKQVWRWSEGRFFAMMLGKEVLQPGEALRFAATWDQQDSGGSAVGPGRYEMIGVVTTSPEVISEPVVVEIDAESRALE